jgi:L-ascorbate metabolism protein UlaG (beta-lactamase superfamily)
MGPPRSLPRRLLGMLGFTFGVLLLALVVLTVAVGWVLSGPRYRGPASDNFDGKRFHNLQEIVHPGFLGFLKWQLRRQRGAWETRIRAPGPPPPARAGSGDLRITFVNHATALIQMDGVNVLTDPIWSDRASPFTWVGPRRRHSPGVRFEDLPSIDAVVVSHSHYDHLDLPTLRRLAAAHDPRFFIGLGSAPLLRGAGIDRVTEIDWWQSQPLTESIKLTGVPAQHFSNRGLFDRDATLWLGFALRGPAGLVYFAGDTGAGPHFAELRRRLGPPRLAILPIGAYLPRWFMRGVHISPEEALEAHELLGAGTSVGIHFGTFILADDGQDEPVRALEAAMARRRERPRFWVLGFGEGRDVPPR